MYKIATTGEGRNFECALHFFLTDRSYSYLYGASFVGFPSAAWAVDAALCGMRKDLTISDENGNQRSYLPISAMRHFEKRVDRLVHVLAVPKTSLLFDAKENNGAAVVISWDGDDIKRLVGEYLAKHFDLPWDLAGEYHKLFYLDELVVVRDPALGNIYPVRYPTRAVRIGVRPNDFVLTAEKVDAVVSRALRSGQLKIPKTLVQGKYTEGQTLREYLKANAQVFATQVSQVKPLYDPEKVDKLDPAIVMERIPFPAQAHAIQALANLLKEKNTAILCGDMGTGKSIISTGIANVLYHRGDKKPMSVLLTAPGMVVPKWCEFEIGATLPEAKVIQIGSANDAQAYQKKGGRWEVVTAAQYLNRVRDGYKPEGLEFVVLSIDRAKLGPASWRGTALWKRVKGEKDQLGWHCPDCGNLLVKVIDKTEVPLSWSDFVESPCMPGLFDFNGYQLAPANMVRWKQKVQYKKCPSCGAVLVRPALKNRGETNQSPRWYAALILKKLKKHFALYISDEVHQTRAENSGRGFAFATLVKAAKKNLCLTGTLVTGMSTSIKEILWRTDPEALIQDGFDAKTGAVTWAGRYGVLEKTTRITESDDGSHTRRRRYQDLQPVEKPGISPELVANHLLHQAVFLELNDLGLPLVRLVEKPVIVQLDDWHAELYNEFHDDLYRICRDSYMAGNRAAFAKFIPSTINAVDRPDREMEVQVGRTVVRFPGLGKDFISAKEEKLVEIVQENLTEGRGCVIYCHYTSYYAVHHRVRDVLKKHGIDSIAVLESSVSPDDRVTWLAEQARKGTKVIICNMSLVETGLDLLHWPTIIYYQLSYDINTVRQASRRAWRIGQTRECRIYYLVTDGTQQLAQFQTCLEKRAHAMMTEGRLDKSEMRGFINGGRMSLAADIAQCIVSEDIGLKWTKLAEKDLEDVEMYGEEEFQAVLKRAQERLAAETLRLCGIEEVVEVEEAEAAEAETVKKPTYADLLLLVPKRTRRKRKKDVLPDGVEQLTLFAV